jgi:prepilin-type N-terminal cleavage/methylation domain-containing protein
LRKSLAIKSCKGMTLIEILVVCSILLVFMGACYSLLVRGVRTFRGGEQRTSMLSEVRMAMNYFTRDFREGAELLFPLPSDISGSREPYSSPMVVILRKDSMAVSYYLDGSTGSIMKATYIPDIATFDRYLTWIGSQDNWVLSTDEAPNPRVIGKNMESLTFSWEDVIPPQDKNADTTLNTVYSPQVIKFSLKAKDDPDAAGSGMAIWSKMRLRY